MKKALVHCIWIILGSLACLCDACMEYFCERYDYDLICFSDSIDSSVRASLRSVAWQKLICHEHPKLRDYDYILWLDADVLINPRLQILCYRLIPIKSMLVMSLPGGSDIQVAHLAKSWYLQQSQTFEQRYPGSKFQGYSNIWGFGDGSGPLINTGFLLFSPSLHGHFSGMFMILTMIPQSSIGAKWFLCQKSFIVISSLMLWISDTICLLCHI